MQVPFYTPVREYHARKAEFDHAVQHVFESGDFILGEDVAALKKRPRPGLAQSMRSVSPLVLMRL